MTHFLYSIFIFYVFSTFLKTFFFTILISQFNAIKCAWIWFGIISCHIFCFTRYFKLFKLWSFSFFCFLRGLYFIISLTIILFFGNSYLYNYYSILYPFTFYFNRLFIILLWIVRKICFVIIFLCLSLLLPNFNQLH